MAARAIVLGVVLSVVARASAEEPRLFARLAGTVQGARTPGFWTELTVRGPAREVRRTCAALVENERRDVERAEPLLTMAITRACSPSPLPSAGDRHGVVLRSRTGLDLLELDMVGLGEGVRGESVTFSAMRDRKACEAARKRLELQAFIARAEAAERAREFLVDHRAQLVEEAKQTCDAVDAAKRAALPRAKKARRALAKRLEQLTRRCRVEQGLADGVDEEAQQAGEHAPAFRLDLTCIGD